MVLMRTAQLERAVDKPAFSRPFSRSISYIHSMPISEKDAFTHVHFWVHKYSRLVTILHPIHGQQGSNHGVLLRELAGDEVEVRCAGETNTELKGRQQGEEGSGETGTMKQGFSTMESALWSQQQSCSRPRHVAQCGLHCKPLALIAFAKRKSQLR